MDELIRAHRMRYLEANAAAPAVDQHAPPAPQAQLRAIVVDVLGPRPGASHRRLHEIRGGTRVDRDQQLVRGLEAVQPEAVGAERPRTRPSGSCHHTEISLLCALRANKGE
jgi:hypothetical protein